VILIPKKKLKRENTQFELFKYIQFGFHSSVIK